LRQLRVILFRIALPKFRSKETLIVSAHSFFLVLRTVLSLAVAKLDGRIVKDLVTSTSFLRQSKKAFSLLTFLSLGQRKRERIFAGAWSLVSSCHSQYLY
jgi:hypothetical protein